MKTAHRFSHLSTYMLVFALLAELPSSARSPKQIRNSNIQVRDHDNRNGKGVSASENADPLDSSISGNVYTNRYFRFSIEFPKGWTVIPPPNRPHDSNGPEPGDTAPSNHQDTYSLLLVVEGSPGVAISKRQRIGVLASRLKNPKMTIPDQLKAGAQSLKDKNSRTQMIGMPERVVVRGREMWKQKMSVLESGSTHSLTMFATKDRDFALQFVFWEAARTKSAETASALDSLNFF